MDGMPLDGRPGYQVTPTTWLVYSGAVIYAIDPVTGYNRWTYARYGCHIDHVVLGAAGALISQNCSGLVKCASVKFCGRGPQLLLRDGNAGESDKAKPNADQVKWATIGDDSVPVSADQVMSSVDPGGRTLHLLDPAKGTHVQSVPLRPSTAQLGPITAIPTADAEVVWLSGRTYALHADSTAPVWAATTISAPTVVSTTRDVVPPLATARITVPSDRGIAVLDGNDGRVSSHFAVTPPPTGSRVYSLGTGFLVSDPAGIVAYR
jgi:outer membrane protein assembly factor BamB